MSHVGGWNRDSDLIVLGYGGGIEEEDPYLDGLKFCGEGAYYLALESFDETIRLHSEDRRHCTLTFHKRGLSLHNLGTYDDAIDSFKKLEEDSEKLKRILEQEKEEHFRVGCSVLVTSILFLLIGLICLICRKCELGIHI